MDNLPFYILLVSLFLYILHKISRALSKNTIRHQTGAWKLSAQPSPTRRTIH